MLIDLQSVNSFHEDNFRKNQKHEHTGLLKAKILIYFMEITQELLSLLVRHIKVGTVKDHGHTYKLYVFFSLMKLSNMVIV
jgi:hypothetical protein